MSHKDFYFNLNNRISNIIYSKDFHLPYQHKFLNHNSQNITHLLKDEFQRIYLKSNNHLTHPKYLFLSLYSSLSHNTGFGIYDQTNYYKWTFKDHHIMNNHSKLFLNIKNSKLILSKYPLKWEITSEGFLKTDKLYISLDINYHIELTKNKSDATPFHFEGNGIHYIKPTIRIQFEINNIINSIDPVNIYSILSINNGVHIGVLLAAGIGSRFNLTGSPKQLYQLDGVPLLMYSFNAMKNIFNHILIITNTSCLEEINSLIKGNDNITVLINDINCRLESIETAINYIHKHIEARTITIHDSARPFVPMDYFDKLLQASHSYPYSQFSLGLVNGLGIMVEDQVIPVDRNQYIEICTPLLSHFNLFYFIFKNYISKKNRIVHELLPILNLLKIKYNLINGSYKYLKKITFMDDL